MRKLFVPVLSILATFAIIAGCTDAGSEPPMTALKQTPTITDTVRFSTVVQPILLNNCAISGCHTGSSPASGFNQSSYAGVRAGGVQFGTNVVIPGDSTDSKIIQKLRGKAGERMPLAGTYAATGLPDSLIVEIGTWIMQGAKDN